MGLTLKLQYDDEEDYGVILDQLQTENVDHIDFTAAGPDNGPFQQDAANVCDILAKILAKPDLKKITYFLDFDHDLEFDFPKNYDVKKLNFYFGDFTFWIWKKIMESTPNVEEIYIYTEQDITELPMMIQSLNGFKKLKSLIVTVDNCCEEEELEELEILSMEDKKLLAQETIKIMNDVLPIKVKASVAEILDLDHPEDKLVLIEKEANEDPKLIMLQKFGWRPTHPRSRRWEEQPAPVEPIQRHCSQVEPQSLTAVYTVAVVIAIIALLIYSIFTMY